MATTNKGNNGDNSKDPLTLSQQLFRPTISTEESQVLYNQSASSGSYDQMSVKAKYFNAYDKLMAAILELFPTRRDITIIDVGSGTGIIGQKLHDLGFLAVDALDPATEMLKVSDEKKVYRRHIKSFFTEDPIDCIDNDTYDLLLMCGVCGPGAINVEAFKEAVRIVKPGGYLVNCMRAEYLHTIPEYSARWEPFMKQLEDQGKLTLVSEHEYPSHFFQFDGLRFIHRVL